MPPVRPFRTSLYLSLGIAVAAIGVAGGDLLPEIPYITVFCVLLLGVAYALEGRIELSLRDANLVGLLLLGLLGLWGVFQFVRTPTGLADTLPWPASALPYLAPVLMLLIPAKMLRPKHIGDYWTMHGLGLLAIALACALASEGGFIVVFGLYAVTFVWSMAAFHLYRELGPELAGRVELSGGRWRATRPAIKWAAIAGVAAMPVFWITPRSGSQWELGINTRGRQTGLSDGPVDLNTTGTISVNRDRAFEVRAETADGRPFLDVSTNQRWRAATLHNYQNGRWGRNQSGFQTPDRASVPPPNGRPPELPNLGPSGIYLEFIPNAKLIRTPPLADPVAWRTNDSPPVVSQLERGSLRSWIHRHDGSMDGTPIVDAGQPKYTQVWAAPKAPGAGQVMRVQTSQIEYLHSTRGLQGLKEYTNHLIERLVSEGLLPPDVLTDVDPVRLHRAARHHEAIGRALEKHLANSGEFTYTLDLTRKDKSIDPTEDFLFNTKSGHCQRFATALVLMLRSQGIPAQLVLGYRGCEGRGDGWYDIREDQAHAWVEVMVAVSLENAASETEIVKSLAQVFNFQWFVFLRDVLAAAKLPVPQGWRTVRWLTLDPTPVGGADEETESPSLLSQARQRWDAVLKALLLAYDKDSREQAAEALKSWVTNENGGFYLVGVGLALFGIWSLRRRLALRAAQALIGPQSLRRLLAILARGGIVWPSGLTAREFARSAGETLRAIPATAGVAGIPEVIVTSYYAERFGELVPGPDERRELDAELTRLDAALR